MAAQAVQYVNAAGYLLMLGDTAWDTSWLLSEQSLFGRLLHTLIGYTERPSGMQLIVYVATLLAMYLLMRFARVPEKKRREATV
jgi:high-affinity iron transporter